MEEVELDLLKDSSDFDKWQRGERALGGRNAMGKGLGVEQL